MATSKNVIVERDTKNVTVSRSDTRTGTTSVTADPSYTLVETDADTLVEKSISRDITVEDRTYYTGPPGPAGPPGPKGDPGGSLFDPNGYYGIGPSLTYTGNLLTRVDYDNGDYKLLSYVGTQLTQIDWVLSDKIIRKTLSYTGARLDAVTQTELPV